MAKHRCFSKDIVRSDTFINLPISAQCLYFHLGMEADDRGYVNNALSIARSIGSNPKDLKLLVNKKFVLKRETNLFLIKGWRINNTIQPSRLVETKYTNDLIKLYFDENNSYTETPTESACQQNVNKMSTNCQHKLSKDKLSKDNNNINEMNNILFINNEKSIVDDENAEIIRNTKWVKP